MKQQSASASQRGGGGGRELQGPRPAPLKVRKESHKIRKQPSQEPVQQLRQPVIIYTMSPKVVHANAAEFMSVVQRLTGAPRATATPPQQPNLPLPLFAQPLPSFPFHLQDAWPLEPQHLPAAIEQAAARSSGADLPPLPSILSPVPGTLPAIPRSFFSQPAPAGALGELISPAVSAPPFLGATAAASAAPSPSPMGGAGAGAYYWDLFNNINMQQQQQQHYHHQN